MGLVLCLRPAPFLQYIVLSSSLTGCESSTSHWSEFYTSVRMNSINQAQGAHQVHVQIQFDPNLSFLDLLYDLNSSIEN